MLTRYPVTDQKKTPSSSQEPVPDSEVIAVTKKIDFEKVAKRLRASSEGIPERHRVSQDDLSLEVSF